MANSLAFNFAGKSIVRPGMLSDTSIGNQRVFQLLPGGVIAFVGVADGGHGGGSVYHFDDPGVARRFLRSGPLVDAINAVGNLGSLTSLIAVVVGTKTSSTLAYTGAAAAAGTFTSGDQGAYTTGIKVGVVTGTTGFAAVFQWTDASGRVVTYGGLGSRFDNLTTLAQLKAAIEADSVLTPPAGTGLLPIIVFTIGTAGSLAAQALAPLAGGTGGSGASAPDFAAWSAGIDALANEAFDIGHLVGCYDETTHAYFDAQMTSVAPFGRLRRGVHQALVTGAAPTSDMVTNSLALTNSGISEANALNSIRSSVCVQKVLVRDPNTGNATYVDLAILVCGLAALLGAKGQWGPATPLTYEAIPTALDLDYSILDTTGDQDACCTQGVIIAERFGRRGTLGSIRIVQSLTTAPYDSNGNPWIFREFSVVRVADALLANVRAAVEQNAPKALGAGNTIKTRSALVGDVRDVLELAIDKEWITDYDPAAISISPTGGLGTDDIAQYSAAPTLPLNHLGIKQTMIPFATTVSTGGVVNG